MTEVQWRELLGWGEEQFEELRNAGYAYVRQGKYDIARPFFEALVVLNPDNAYDVQTLGAIHLELGNADDAHKFLDRALQLDTDHSPTLLNLAKALFMLGKKEEGLKLASILQDDPNKKVSNIAKALILAYG